MTPNMGQVHGGSLHLSEPLGPKDIPGTAHHLIEEPGSLLASLPRMLKSFKKLNFLAMWDLVPWPGIRPATPSLEVWSLNQRTTR